MQSGFGKGLAQSFFQFCDGARREQGQPEFMFIINWIDLFSTISRARSGTGRLNCTPSAGTVALPTIMIGEKVAEMIRGAVDAS
jgi:hypothetical protein